MGSLSSHRKYLITLAALVVSVILLMMPLGVLAASKAKGGVSLRVTQALKVDRGLEVTFEIINRSETDIWIYVGDNRDGIQSYETSVSKKDGKVYLGFRSPEETDEADPEDALVSRYKKLMSGRNIMFRLVLDAVVSDYHVLKGRGEGRLNSGDIREIEIELGYYADSLDALEECCMPVDFREELYVVPAWASTHPESTVSTSVSKRKRWK